MSQEPRRDDRPDFNEIFRHELGPCEAQVKKPRRKTLPDRLQPGHPVRWDDNAKHWATLWKVELVTALEGGHKKSPKELADICCEYARLCFLNGNAGEVVALAKMTIRQLSCQPDDRQGEAYKELNRTYQRVIQLAIGCGFYAPANEFIRFAIELGELIGQRHRYHLHNVKPFRPVIWQAWHLDLADCCLKAGRVDEALQALDKGVDASVASDLRPLQLLMDFEAVRIAFHHGKRPDAFRRCLEIIEHYNPKAPNQLPVILKAKGLYEEFFVGG